MQAITERPSRLGALREELVKIPAFFRRDLMVLWSYRTAFFSDWANLLVQVLIFYFLSRIVPVDALPRFDGRPVTYIEFVAVGLLLTTFMQVSLSRLVSVVQTEQLMGTLDSLFVTPTAPITFMFGSVSYDLLYVPLRTAVFVLLATGLLGVDFNVAGFLPAAVILLAFIPFTWGLGVISAALILTLKRGSGSLGIVITILILGSGAYFPVQYLPGWVETLTQANPITIALDAAREALLGTTQWNEVWSTVLALVPWAIASLVAGTLAFRLALNRERRRGTMGMY